MSTKGRYAILAMYELALHYGKESMSIKSISDNQGIPKQYLDQLMKKLREAELVVSARGAKGGYSLSSPPKDITIGQIIRAVEEPTKPVECDGGKMCKHFDCCVAKVLWNKIANSISEVIDYETLQDMLNY